MEWNGLPNIHDFALHVGNIVNTAKPFLLSILQQDTTVFSNVRIRRLCRPKHTIYIVLCLVILHTSSPINRGIIVLKNVIFFWIVMHNYRPYIFLQYFYLFCGINVSIEYNTTPNHQTHFGFTAWTETLR